MRLERQLLLTLTVLLLLSCGQGREDGPFPGNRGIRIGVDPRMELLNVVQLLAGAPGIRDPGSAYSAEVSAYFSEWSGHEAVGVIRELAGQGFGYDAPVTAVLHLSDPPALEQVTAWTENLSARAGGMTNLESFATALRNFAEDTDFMSFWKDHEQVYDEISDVYRSVMDPGDAELLESWFGMSRQSYSILPAPLSFHGFGSWVLREDGTMDVFCTIMGATALIPGEVDVETSLFLRSFVWHEFAHSFVNPLCEEYSEELDEYSNLFEPIEWIMSSQAYPLWQICVREHLVRAAVVRLVASEYGPEAGRQETELQLRNGFIYIEPLCEDFVILEQTRETGETFESMFPVFIETFGEIQTSGIDGYADLMGMSINIVLSLGVPVVYVTPSAEEDLATQSRICAYVREICDMFNPDAELLPDTVALSRDLSGKTVIVYGTIRGNLYLREISRHLPFNVTTYGAIETDTLLAGYRMRLISSLPNPREDDSWLLVYTACRAVDVEGINSVLHGPTEFVVADGSEVLQTGFYRRGSGGTWEF